MADYSEFPTTPTAWQEQQWEEVRALENEDLKQPAPRRGVDLVALVPGVLFVLLALVTMADLALPLGFLTDGGFLVIAAIAAGVLLLVRELRRSRRTA
ncbi:hypothetical protein [Blastococcus sp. LR1]|uniref:hypothetical protein n=1 Tax=Blastococcus sp. LR1 TaxID=2877000 RepID=UPI001CCF368A|nr:hypothetical protein [Blastococcus sp. LR1]MCA0146124.1 hypothetical protein [Blastococcus sp. LR1]